MLKKLLLTFLLLLLVTGIAVGQTGKDIRARNLYVGGRWTQLKSYTEVITYGNAYDAFRVNYAGTGNDIFEMQADGVMVMRLAKDGTLTLLGTTAYTPSAAQAITAAGDAILANATIVEINPDDNYTLTSTPTIADGETGQILYVTAGSAETKRVTVQDQDTLADSNLQLLSPMATIYANSTLVLRFNGTDWEEVSYVLDGSISEYNVKDFGATGDGATDDHDAIEAAATFAAAAGGLLLFPGGQYNVSSTVTIPAGCDIEMLGDAQIYYTGVAQNEACLEIGDPAAGNNLLRRFTGLNVKRATVSDWTDRGSVGIKLLNLYRSFVNIRFVQGFTVGVMGIGTGTGFVQNTINVGQIVDNRYGIVLTNDSSGGIGWANANYIYGGLISVQSGVNTAITAYGIVITSEDGAYENNNSNRVSGVDIEITDRTVDADAIGIQITYGANNIFTGIRMENSITSAPDTTGAITTGTDQLVVASATGWSTSMVIRVVGAGVAGADLITTVDGIAGVTFTLADNADTTVSGALVDHDAYDLLAHTENSSWSNTFKFLMSTSYEILDESTHHANPIFRNSYVEMDRGLCIFNSGAMHKNAAYFDGATDANVPNVHLASSGNANVYTDLANIDIEDDYLQAPATVGFGVFVDTSIAKKFTVTRDCNDGFGGRISIRSYDADGLIITDGVTLRAISRRQSSALGYSGYYGKVEMTGTDQGTAFAFEVTDDVKRMAVILHGWTNAMQIRSFSLYSIEYLDAAVWPGYEEIAPGSNIGTTSPTAGKYEVGRMIYDVTPVEGAAQGWECVSRVDATLDGGEPLGEDDILLDDSTGMSVGDIAGVTQDDDPVLWTTITDVDIDGVTITIADVLTDAAGTGLDVFTYRFTAFGMIGIGEEETITVDSSTLKTWASSKLDSTDNKVDCTLGSGQYIGQIKTIVMIEASNSSDLSITNHQTEDPEVATFDAVDETGVFMWTGTEWVTIFATCTF